VVDSGPDEDRHDAVDGLAVERGERRHAAAGGQLDVTVLVEVLVISRLSATVVISVAPGRPVDIALVQVRADDVHFGRVAATAHEY